MARSLRHAVVAEAATRPGRRPKSTPPPEAVKGAAAPGVVIVKNLQDSGAGSLREAVQYADSHANTTIKFANHLHGTIKLTSGELAITESMIIDGPGAACLTVSGTSHSRVFSINPDTTVTISGLTISHGLADGTASGVSAFGGGILNQGNLTLKDTIVSHNQAAGAASDTMTLSGGSGLVITGTAAGGGVANLGALTVSHSQFVANEARAGDGCVSSGPAGVAGDAAGGAIASFGFTPAGTSADVTLSVSFSQFSKNQAIGGNDNQSALLPGHAFGGAVASHRFAGSADLKVSHCTFNQNKSLGGNHNVVVNLPGQVDPEPRAVPNMAAAGGVTAIGTGMISESTFEENEAIGGQGVAGSSGIPITKDGGDGRGGGIGVAFKKTVVTVSKCTVKHNQATGGKAGAGGNGGDAWGGGIAITAAGAELTITGGSIIESNQAQGGKADASGPPSSGGDGLGGGLYNYDDSSSKMILTGCSINHNGVSGGKGKHGGTDGQHLGRSIYSLGTLITDPATVIR